MPNDVLPSGGKIVQDKNLELKEKLMNSENGKYMNKFK